MSSTWSLSSVQIESGGFNSISFGKLISSSLKLSLAFDFKHFYLSTDDLSIKFVMKVSLNLYSWSCLSLTYFNSSYARKYD